MACQNTVKSVLNPDKSKSCHICEENYVIFQIYFIYRNFNEKVINAEDKSINCITADIKLFIL